jgi:hypothetical protein
MKRKLIEEGEKVAVNLTTKERLMIEEETFLGDEYFVNAIDTDKGISVLLLESDEF